jgi:Domain of unknown function (DUF4282)
MLDRSSHEGLPEEWNHGSHAARGPFPFPGPGASDGFDAGAAGSHRARTADGFGIGPTDAYGAVEPEALVARTDWYGAVEPEELGVRTDSYGPGTTDALGARTDLYGAAKPEAVGVRTDSYGAGKTDASRVRPAGAFGAAAADPFGDAGRFGAADPFGPGAADPFGSRAAEPFGALPAEPFGARPAEPFGAAATAASGMAEAGTARMEAERPAVTIRDPAPGPKADAKGFLGALFDFGFTSFVTPKVIKVLYTLIVIGTVLSALVFTIMVFEASVAFGVLTLVFGDPLFILIVLAIYRIILEFFVVTFRVAEDIRALRERGDLH